MEKDKINLPNNLIKNLLETRATTQYDSITPHLFSLVEKSNSDGRVPAFKLSLRGRLLLMATAAAYYQQEKQPYILLTTGNVLGENYPSVAEVAKNELETKYKITPDKIVICLTDYGGKPSSETTAEIEAIQKTRRQQGWTNILEIAEPEHLKTIRGLYSAFYRTEQEGVSFKQTDQILDQQTLKRLLPKLRQSRFELNLKGYEFLKRFLVRGLKYDPAKFKAEKAKLINNRKSRFVSVLEKKIFASEPGL